MEPVVYVNGGFTPRSQASVSVFDRGYLYGDGVFEGIRGYDGRIFRLDQHLERLYRGARTIALEIPLTFEEFREVILETVRRNNLSDCYIRAIVSRGVGDLGLDPGVCKEPTVVIIADTIALYPAAVYKSGLNVITCVTRRSPTTASNPEVKSLNYLNNILARAEARRAGAHEGLMMNQEGYVVEATGDNVFIWRDGRLITPPAYAGILEGITRQVVVELASEMELPLWEAMLTTHQIYSADECFLTGTAAEVVPVAMVDGRPIGDGKPGPVTTRLMARFKEVTATEGVPVG